MEATRKIFPRSTNKRRTHGLLLLGTYRRRMFTTFELSYMAYLPRVSCSSVLVSLNRRSVDVRVADVID